MADPKTWDALAAFETVLERITVANGFQTDAGQYVTREPAQIPSTEPALIAIALDSIGRATEPALLRTHRLATVLVVGKVPTAQDNAQIQLHRVIEDVERAFARRQADFPIGIQFPDFIEARPVPPAEGMTWIGVEMRYATHVPKPTP